MEKSSLYTIYPGNPLYRRAAKREAATWGRPHFESTVPRYPINHPLVTSHLGRAILGRNDTVDWLDWFVGEYGPFESALSLGCGMGHVERRMLDSGLFKRLDAVDISPSAIDAFREQVVRLGLDVEVEGRVGDLNFIELPEETYDFVLAVSSLHHLINLEHLFEQIRRALKPGGLFLTYDFCGPSAWQWPDATLDEVNRIVDEARNRFPGLVLYRVRRPNPVVVRNHSPFESVRSSELPALLGSGFEPVREVLTGRLLFVLLHYGVEMDDWEEPMLKEWLREVIAREERLDDESGMPPCLLWGLYRPGEKPFPSPVPWDEQEIRRRIGIGFWNPRGWALDLVGLLPGRGRLIDIGMKLKRRFGWY